MATVATCKRNMHSKAAAEAPTSLRPLSSGESSTTSAATAATSPFLSSVNEDLTVAKFLSTHGQRLGCSLKCLELNVCKALGLACVSVKGCRQTRKSFRGTEQGRENTASYRQARMQKAT